MPKKVAVFFSGLLRGPFEEYAERTTQCFDPEHTDFFYTTWKRKYGQSEWDNKTDGWKTRIKHPPRSALVNHYFDEPEQNFQYDLKSVREYIRAYRKMEENGWDTSKLPRSVTQSGMRSLEDLKDDLINPARNFRMMRHQHKQTLAHAWAVDHLIDRRKYDLIVRVRYDTVVMRHLRDNMSTLLDLCYDTKMPIGFNYLNYWGMKNMYPGRFELKYHPTEDLHDFMIIHRADMIDVNYINYLYAEKKMCIAETGWYQALCAPYNVFSWETLGLVKLHAQHVDEQKWFDWYRKRPGDHYRNTYKEKMKAVVGNIGANL